MLSSAESDLVRRDRAIPGLGIVLDPDAFVGALRRAEPEADLRMAQVMYVRYKPQRYCRVAYRLDLAGTELDVDVRACRREDLAQWLEAQSWASGARPLEPSCLLRLVLGCWTRQAEATDVLSLSSEIGFICPRLARQADALARRLAGQLAGAPAVHCVMHGDFSANQVLVGQEAVAIIDLDWACYGDPADDLGNFIAQAERKALHSELAPGRVELLREAMLEGYRLATKRPLPQRIGLYTAVEVFRRARFPFRGREPDWPQRTEALLKRAGAILDSLS